MEGRHRERTWYGGESLPAESGFPSLEVDPSRRRWIVDAFEQAGRASRGRFYAREGFSNHAGDTLAAIRGTEQVSPKGLLISTSCATEAEGRDLVRMVERSGRRH